MGTINWSLCLAMSEWTCPSCSVHCGPSLADFRHSQERLEKSTTGLPTGAHAARLAPGSSALPSPTEVLLFPVSLCVPIASERMLKLRNLAEDDEIRDLLQPSERPSSSSSRTRPCTEQPGSLAEGSVEPRPGRREASLLTIYRFGTICGIGRNTFVSMDGVLRRVFFFCMVVGMVARTVIGTFFVLVTDGGFFALRSVVLRCVLAGNAQTCTANHPLSTQVHPDFDGSLHLLNDTLP